MRHRMRCSVRLSGGFLLLFAFLFFLDDSWLLVHFLIACLAHELGHFLALWAFGGHVRSVRLTAAGAEIELGNPAALSYPKELLAVLAGPAAGILLALLAARAAEEPGLAELYVLAGVSLALSVFNLLPVRVLDGGQAVYLLLCWLIGPAPAEGAVRVLSLVTVCLLSAGGTAAALAGGGCGLILAAAFLAGQIMRPARPWHVM